MLARVLVVDDSEVNLLVAETKLTESGFSVQCVSDGESALVALKLEEDESDCPFDAVLLDIMMPGIDGMEVLARIRKVRSPIQLPVVMATAKDQTEDVVAALSVGANDYVTKPLDLPILVARLKTHIDSKKVHEELKKAQQALVSAARIESVGFLAAGVAHEIRNPLGRIQMSVGGLKGLIQNLPGEYQEMGTMIADTVEESVHAADNIVQALMRASEDQQLPLEEVELNDYLSAEIETLLPELENANIGFSFEPGDFEQPVLLAEEPFRQVINEVVKNAILSMGEEPNDQKRLSIRTEESVYSGSGTNTGGRSGNRLRNGDRVAELIIEDSGPGMSAEALESAFDPFYSTRATGVGTGMGLTVVRKILELHNGLIRLEPRPDGKSGLRVVMLLKMSRGFRTNV